MIPSAFYQSLRNFLEAPHIEISFKGRVAGGMVKKLWHEEPRKVLLLVYFKRLSIWMPGDNPDTANVFFVFYQLVKFPGK
jgi:hypothetical protein